MRLALMVGLAFALVCVFCGAPRAAQAIAQKAGVEGGAAIDVNYAIRLLFKWWTFACVGYWGVIGTLYGVLWIADRSSRP